MHHDIISICGDSKIQWRNHDTDSHGGRGGDLLCGRAILYRGFASVIQSMETLRKYQMVNSKLSVHPYACYHIDSVYFNELSIVMEGLDKKIPIHNLNQKISPDCSL